MDKEDRTDSETIGLDWRGWLGLAVLLLVCGFAVVETWWSDQHFATSHGMTVAEWLYAKEVPPLKDSEDLVLGFGEGAIPYLERAYLNSAEGDDEIWKWFRGVVKKLGVDLQERAGWEARFDRAFRALVILGRKYPDHVSPIFMRQFTATSSISRGESRAWSSPERTWAIYGLAGIGTQHFSLITNLLTSSSGDDSGSAIGALGTMGAGAVPAVPLAINAIERQAATNELNWSGTIHLPQFGAGHPQLLPWLFKQLVHTNELARNYSAAALGRMTNSYSLIGPELLRVARLPVTNGVDFGVRPAAMLPRVGVPVEQGLPVLRERFFRALETERPDPNPKPCMSWYYALRASQYGTNAVDLAPAINAEYLRRAKLMPPSGSRSRFDRTPAGQWLHNFERFLPRIDPTWSWPVEGP